jgi:NAD(P)-dependent dehydrogenase (short-subunit alcohol dehydrogenase family)
VHLKGHFGPLRHATDHWRERSKADEEVNAAVINTSSGSGTFIPNPGQFNYGAAKAGIAAMTIIAASELERIGVRVNAICPEARTRATLATPGPIGEMMKAPTDPEALDVYAPDHVAALVAFLATADCPLTGKCFRVNGSEINEMTGWTLGPAISSDGEGWTPARVAEALSAAVA